MATLIPLLPADLQLRAPPEQQRETRNQERAAEDGNHGPRTGGLRQARARRGARLLRHGRRARVGGDLTLLCPPAGDCDGSRGSRPRRLELGHLSP